MPPVVIFVASAVAVSVIQFYTSRSLNKLHTEQMDSEDLAGDLADKLVEKMDKKLLDARHDPWEEEIKKERSSVSRFKDVFAEYGIKVFDWLDRRGGRR